jgi:2-methylcitrate dehydratase PrpD
MTELATPTQTLATYAAQLQVADLPPGVLVQARAVLADTIAVMLSASRKRAVNTALAVMSLPDPHGSTVIGHGTKVPAAVAAFINGIGGHDIELDDSHSPSRTHAAGVVVSAALAAAELGEAAGGADVLAGIIAGYDVQVRVSKAMGVQRQFDRGFHPSAVCGAIGAAVAAGRVLGISPEVMRSCIALAASQSSGLMTFEEDASHMAKSFQTGVAARNGVYAAALAQAGFMAAPDVLTDKHNLLVPFGGPDPDYAQLTDALGVRFDITETSLKRHACCGQTHASIDAVLLLQAEHGIRWDEIEDVDVQVSERALDVIDNNPLWTHNIQYVLALAAHEGSVRPEHFSDEWTGNAEIRELATRVHVRGSEVLQARFPEKKGGIVAMRTSRGLVTKECQMPVGNPEIPLSEAELRDKFVWLAGDVLGPAAVESLWNLLRDVDTGRSMSRLFELIGARPS